MEWYWSNAAVTGADLWYSKGRMRNEISDILNILCFIIIVILQQSVFTWCNFFPCLCQRQCTAAGIFMEGIPRSDGLAAGRSVYLRGGCVAVHALSGQWHHWNTGEPSWADLSLAQSLHCPVLRRLRELQTLSRWGSGPCSALCQAIRSHLSQRDLDRVKPRLHDKYHTNPEASSSIWSYFWFQ